MIGKCGKSLNINFKWNGYDICQKDSEFYLIDDGTDYEEDIEESARINVDYEEEWVDKPWRFSLKGN